MDILNATPSRWRNLGKRGSGFFMSDRDRKILHFLWKWKLASTASIHEAVCRPQTPYSTYKALERLAKNKFIQTEDTFEQNFSSWVLTDRGFESIRRSLGDLAEEGYKSENHWHDRNIVAFQLGEWATHQLPIVSFFTEQEMRRRSVECYPHWVPKTKDHRPDGYTRIKTDEGDLVLAMEVELWLKALSVYETTLKFYQLMRGVHRVYWLAGSESVKEQILRARDCIKEKTENLHVFVDIDDYIRDGWEAKVTNERSGNLGTFRKTMQEICGDIYGKQLGTNWGKSGVTAHYDTRKVLGKKRT
ncbi:MAG: hypothetical protein KF789_02440 [Bdellovibrionaceae bacterium]|nr:hypothetical protein [Pseudobdellovibrionaceae bacterium]